MGAIGDPSLPPVAFDASGAVTQKLGRMMLQLESIMTGAGGATMGALVDRGGTITSGGISQQMMGENTSRRYLFVQNISATGTLWINFANPAAMDQSSIELTPKSEFVMEGSFIATDEITAVGPTTGQSFVAKESG